MAAQQGHIVPAKPAPLDAHIISPPVPLAQMSDADLAKAAAEAIDKALTFRETSIEHAKRAGELLMEARHRCREGGVSFRHWLQKHWVKSHATAYAYISIATEVQPSSVSTLDQEPKDLLSCNSIRAFLTDRRFDATGARAAQDAEEREAEDERTMERLVKDADGPPAQKPERRAQRPPAAPHRAEEKSDAEKARQATAAADAARWRTQVEEAKHRPPLTQQPPENPHQVGHPKAKSAAPEDVPCSANELREIATRMDALSRDAAALSSDLNAVALFEVGADDPRAELADVKVAVEALSATVASTAKKRGHQLREIANHESRVIGAERERRAKAVRNRKGA